MAASADSTDNVTALIECSLCLTTFQQPKCLPCIHTFCLDCLQKYVERNEANDVSKLPCPLCRQTFVIPPQGLSSLPNNFFIQRMIEFKKKSGTESDLMSVRVQCDLCLDESDAERSQTASKYCLECNQNMCQSCVTCHGRMNVSKSHALASLNEKLEDTLKVVKNCSRFCDSHSNEIVRLYCVKCDVGLCVPCMLDKHSDHKCEDIKAAFSKYLDQFDMNISTLQDVLTQGQKSVEDLKAAEAEIIEEAARNEQKIRGECDEVRKILDNYEEELLGKVREFREKRVKEIKTKLDQVEFQSLQLDGFVRYLKELTEKGSNYDVACSGKELVRRAEHLVTLSKKVFTAEKMIHMRFISDTINSRVDGGRKLVGELVTGEKLLVAVGLNNSTAVVRNICHVDLDKPDTTRVINSTSVVINAESAACAVRNDLYAVGVGGADKELWKWSVNSDRWMQWADMPTGRRKHCVTSVGDKIYVLGGLEGSGLSMRALDNIFCYDINSDKWSEAGKLRRAVKDATCVTYRHCVYVFGGDDSWNAIVQVYDPDKGTAQNYSTLKSAIPSHQKPLLAVRYESVALLIGKNTCYLYDFESDTWQERGRFKTDMSHFGLTLDDKTLYISGGDVIITADQVLTCKHEVKSLSVDDFLTDSMKAEWKHHATLPAPAAIPAYNSVVLYK